MMCDERLWQPQIAALAQRTVVPDTTRDDNFAAMAARILASAPPQFALAGLSMGGILAFELWRQAPERITHMALLDTNPHPEQPARRALRVDEIAAVLAGGLREMAIESMKPAYLAAANRDDEALLTRILDMALELGADVFERQSVALRDRPDSVPTLATIGCPVHIICGLEDTLCPVAYHETMANHIADARLSVLANCGHLSTLEQPDAVNDLLTALFAR